MDFNKELLASDINDIGNGLANLNKQLFDKIQTLNNPSKQTLNNPSKQNLNPSKQTFNPSKQNLNPSKQKNINFKKNFNNTKNKKNINNPDIPLLFLL